MSMLITIPSACAALINTAFRLLCMVLLVSACTSGIEQDAVSSPMKFTLPGGDRLLRAVNASSIEAKFTLLLDGEDSAPAILMSRVGGSSQWETPQMTIPANTGFNFQLSWFAAGVDGISVEYAFQSFRSDAGVNANQTFDVSTLSYNFNNFNNDGDGANNYEELLAGTSPTIFDEDTTDPGSVDVGPTDAGTADGGATDSGVSDAGTTDEGTTDASTADVGTTDSGASDTGTADEGTTDDTASDEGAVDTGAVDSGTSDAGTVDAGTTDSGAADEGSTDEGSNGDPIVPTGGIVGVWFGNNNFGDGVMIVDANENIFSLAANGSGQYETVFGPAAGSLERFLHRDSDNPAFADSFTLVGDSQLDAIGSLAYSLSVQNDGQQIANTGSAGDFLMTFATGDDVAPISLASIAGDWIAKTSFCAVDCNVTLEMTITDAGDVTGSTEFNDTASLPLSGTASIAEASTQYMNIQFTWNGDRRTGVVHIDRQYVWAK